MTTADWLGFFHQHMDLKILYINHLKLLTGLNDHHLRVSLSRLYRKKIIKRICRGFYANPFHEPTLEEISSQIYCPSYISLESAMAAHGVLSQMPRVLTCVTTQPAQIFETHFGSVEYRQIKGEYFWGFQTENGYSLADKSKAVLDYLYFSRSKDRQRKINLLNIADIDVMQLKNDAHRMGLENAVSGLLQSA